MGKLLSYIYAYYNSPEMFLRQIEEWKSYPKHIQRELDIFVTDDCSDKSPLRDVKFNIKNSSFKLHLYELTKKVPWNWLACRNLGAKKSRSDWLVLTDIDHVLSRKSASRIFEHIQNRALHNNWVYLFTRVDAPNNTKYKSHNDSFMMSRKLYWQIGGYDEELSGNYGTSGRYRIRAFNIAVGHNRLPIPLTRYHRSIIDDASTNDFVRKGPGRDPNAIRRILDVKRRERRENEILTLSFPYRRI